MKKIIAIIIIIVVVILAALKLISNRQHNTMQSDVITYNKVTVSVANVQKQNASFTLDFTGTTAPFKELDIPAETSGKITSLDFDLGKSLKQGSVIATIDDHIKKLNYESAKIDADKLKRDYVRTQNLFKGGTSSEQELDKAKASYESAQNKVDEAARQLTYTKVISSIAGIVTKKNIEKGAYVNAGTVIASIVDISRLKVKVNVSENNVYYLKVGDHTKITTSIYPGSEFTGKITYISPNGNEAHNYSVEIEMQNSSSKPIKAGTFVNVGISIYSAKEGYYIPREALMGSLKDAKVYVAENGSAKLRNIVIGRQSGSMIEVLSGLSGQEQIIVSGQVNLSDNKPIKIINNN